MALYNTIKRLIALGRTDGLAEKVDVFYALSKLTEEQYNEIVGLLKEGE